LNIHNRCQDINLTSPVYFIHGGRWHVIPDQEIDVSDVMWDYLEFDSEQDILEGALVYRIQRQNIESDELDQGESKNIQLLVAWCGEYTKGLHVRAFLVEHDSELDKDKLKRLYRKYWHSLDVWDGLIGSNWLLDNETVLMAASIVMNGGYKWSIFIYEEMTEDCIIRPLWMDAERWVSMMLPMDATVYNQYSGIALTSPVCFCSGRTCNEYSVERMDDGVAMKINFGFDLNRNKSEVILMYEVQRNRSNEIEALDPITSLILILHPLRPLKVHRK
jgi:hypothetical protein